MIEGRPAPKFQATIRYWRPQREGGLAVADIPNELIAALGGLKQARVRGTINGAEYVSNVMPAGSGRLALSVSRKMMGDAGLAVGDEAAFEIERIPPAPGDTS
jgi:hypothetical protein